jgi:hypothetical protein
MSDERYIWIVGLVLLGMLADTVSPHPMLDVKNEYQFQGMVPQSPVLGFANERQWLFAHRKYRDRCVLEAFAAEGKQSEDVKFASAASRDAFSLTDLRLRNRD